MLELNYAVSSLSEHEDAVNSFYERKRELEKKLNVEQGKELHKEVLIEYLTGSSDDGYNDINSFIDTLTNTANE